MLNEYTYSFGTYPLRWRQLTWEDGSHRGQYLGKSGHQVHCLWGVDGCALVQPEWRTTGRYRVLGRGEAHASLHGSYMPKLQAFYSQCKRKPRAGGHTNGTRSGRLHHGKVLIFSAVFANGNRRTSPHVVSLAGRCPLIKQRYQLLLRLPWMSHRLHLADKDIIPASLQSMWVAIRMLSRLGILKWAAAVLFALVRCW